MAKEAKNKKYLVLDDVRVSYRAKDDSIHLLSTDTDFPSGFHLPVQKGTHVEDTLRSLLTERGHIKEDDNSGAGLPSVAAWSDSYVLNQNIAPTFFPIGLGSKGGVPVLNPYTGETVHLIGFDTHGLQSDFMASKGIRTSLPLSPSPHTLIAGATGGGKSVLLSNIIRGAVLRPDHWEVLGIDLFKVELARWKEHSDVVLGVANTLAEALTYLRQASETMFSRYDELEKLGLNHVLDLPSTKNLMVVIDEYSLLTTPSDSNRPEDRTDNVMREEITSILGDIARLGRAAGVHLVLVTQRPTRESTPGELKSNIGTRILCGKADQTMQEMTLGTSVRMGKERGRFYMSIYGAGQMGQALFKVNA